ncbi:uncharacterized protein LOC118478290 [Aplysia californica]|uniref:Uncharacterized protein LOC118478290 n=1 Tax=Aplysia californica TaxID=6500 RepID=A0ABM1VYL0_APLCA|nr:uncharacterized protein LOC118478290 [Aplysia californica]
MADKSLEKAGLDNYAYKADFDDKKDVSEGINHVKDETNSCASESKSSAGDDVDLSCGVGRFRTGILGRCYSNVWMFSLLMGVSSMFTTMVVDVSRTHINSLERQFNIDNSEAGWFDTCPRIGFMSSVFLVGHFAKRSHLPVIIGSFGILQGGLLLIPAVLQLVRPYTLPVL